MEIRITLIAEEIAEFAKDKIARKNVPIPDDSDFRVTVDCPISETFKGTQKVATVVFTC